MDSLSRLEPIETVEWNLRLDKLDHLPSGRASHSDSCFAQNIAEYQDRNFLASRTPQFSIAYGAYSAWSIPRFARIFPRWKQKPSMHLCSGLKNCRGNRLADILIFLNFLTTICRR